MQSVLYRSAKALRHPKSLSAFAILDGYGTGFAVGFFGSGGYGYGLAAVEGVDLDGVIGEDGLDKVTHLVEISVGEANEEMVDNVGLCAGCG